VSLEATGLRSARTAYATETVAADATTVCATMSDWLSDRGGWCHAGHSCHHWFEGECSPACDRGEHDYHHGHAGCSDIREPAKRVAAVDMGDTR